MKVQTKTSEVTTIGAGVEHVARIKESAKAFHILSGALYSDKILGVVREISCNAYDAHVANGNPEVPFEIKLPTTWDSTFYVKDFGTGLSEEQIYGLYMTYFESTKQDSDDFIGQLGLGSKSPFSYGATFNVESRFNGEKKIYTCYKNEQQMPAVSLMDTAPTDEPNGLTISLSAKRDDVHAFQRAAKYALMYFPVQPNIVGLDGFAPYDLTYAMEGTNWKARSENNVYDGVRVIQGSVSYPVDIEIVQQTIGGGLSTFITETLPTLNIDLFVPIGDVDIAPSREALTYDLRTAKNLATILVALEKEMMATVQQTFDAFGTHWEAQIYFDELMSMSRYSSNVTVEAKLTKLAVQQGNVPTYDGHKLNERKSIIADDAVLDTLMVTLYQGTNRRVRKLSTEYVMDFAKNPDWSYSITAAKDLCVIVDDMKDARTSNQYLNYHLWTYENSTKYKRALVISESEVTGKPIDQAELQALLDGIGNPVVMKMSDLPAPPKLTGTYKYKPKAKDELYIWNGVHQGAGRYSSESIGPKSWRATQTDLTEGGFYLNIDRWTVLDGGLFNPLSLDRIIMAARNVGILPPNALIVGVNAKKLDIIQKEGDWVDLIQYITDAVVSQKAAWVAEINSLSIIQWANSDSLVVEFIEKWSTEFDAVNTNNQEFVDFIDGFRNMPVVDKDSVEYKRTLCNHIVALKDMVVDGYDLRTQLSAKRDVMLNNNPMLNYVEYRPALRTAHGIELIKRALTK